MSERIVDVMEMTALDRCDRCGAQAYVRVTVGELDLLFCGHHFAENESKLEGFAVDDQRERLLQNSSS